MNPTLRVSEDLNRDSGYSVFTVSGMDGEIERLSYAIVRHGYDHNHLGEQGWQAAFVWIEPEEAWYASGQLKFIVPPALTWQMDPQGYRLKLGPYPPARELSIDFFWPDVLPAEAPTPPDPDHQLSGTRVKPAQAPAALIQPATAFEPPPEPEPVAASVTAPPSPPPAAPTAPPEPTAVEAPSPRDPPAGRYRASGLRALIPFILVTLAALALAYWFVSGQGTPTSPEQTPSPGRSAPHPAEQPAAPTPAPTPISAPTPDPAPSPAQPNPIAAPSASAGPETPTPPPEPEIRTTQPAIIEIEHSAVRAGNPGTPRQGARDTVETLNQILGSEASRPAPQPEGERLNSIEPALRQQMDEGD